MLKLKPKHTIIPRELQGRSKRRRAIKLKFDPFSDNRIIIERQSMVEINKSKSSSVNFEENIQKDGLVKSHSIPLITLRHNKSLALRSQSYPSSIQDLDPDYVPYI